MNRFAKACFLTSSHGVERSSRRLAAESLGEAVFFTRVFNFRYVEFSILGCTF